MPGAYRVVPRLVPVRSAVTQSPTVGAVRPATGLYEDPSLFAGVRPYQPGDQVRRIHWKATARLGRPVSRRYDPAHEREVLLAIDMQTMPGAYWMLNWDDDLVEGLCVTGLSLARRLIVDGVAVGLAVNAFSDRPQRTVFLPPSAAPAQIAAIADRLADVSSYASLPFDAMLAGLAQRAPHGLLDHRPQRPRSGRLPPGPATARRPGLPGQPCVARATRPRAWSARARAAGVRSVAYGLHPDWRTADALERLA